MVTIIPFEVVEDILCRLPVKPLKRFRCVVKSWRSLIDSERFVKSHLKMSLKTNSHRHLIVGGNDGLFYNIDLDNDDKFACVVKLPVLSVNDISNSCNGVFVISAEPLVMWNPFTKEWKKLPGIVDYEFPIPFRFYQKIVCGFAWDSRNDDYKVVRIMELRSILYDNRIESRAHIFGLKSNSWRQTIDFTYSVLNWHVDVNGALHTLINEYNPAADQAGGPKIKAFSVENERHYEVMLPPLDIDNVWESEAVCLSLHKLGGCLAMNYTNQSGIAIWVMKDYGVSGSWTKMLSIPMKLTVRELEDNTMTPLMYTNDDHKVLVCIGQYTFFWQDLRNQTIDSVLVKGLPRVTYVEACVESLVSFSREQVHDQDKKEDMERIGKKRDGFIDG